MGRFWDSSWGMICSGFLSPVDRADLTTLARDGSAAHRLARRANALVEWAIICTTHNLLKLFTLAKAA
jgi:hypothetical protein